MNTLCCLNFLSCVISFVCKVKFVRIFLKLAACSFFTMRWAHYIYFWLFYTHWTIAKQLENALKLKTEHPKMKHCFQVWSQVNMVYELSLAFVSPMEMNSTCKYLGNCLFSRYSGRKTCFDQNWLSTMPTPNPWVFHHIRKPKAAVLALCTILHVSSTLLV